MEAKKQHTFFYPHVSSAMVLNYHKNSFRVTLLSIVTSTKRTTSTTLRKLQASPKFIIKTKRSCRKPRVRTFDQLWFINIIICNQSLNTCILRDATANLSQSWPNILLQFFWPVISHQSVLKPKIESRPRPRGLASHGTPEIQYELISNS